MTSGHSTGPRRLSGWRPAFDWQALASSEAAAGEPRAGAYFAHAGAAPAPALPYAPPTIEEKIMSKGLDQKKSDKKKPAKTMKEKKADKKDKKANKAFGPG